MAAANKFTTCQFILQSCPFASSALATTCVENWCQGEPYGFGSCTTDFTGTPADCCSQDDVASCMAAFQKTQGYANSDDACLQIERYSVACSQANPNFNQFTYKQQAECLCYDDSGNYTPDDWDNAASSCVATGATAHPTVYSVLEANNAAAVGLCTKYAGAAVSSVAAASSTPAVVASSTNSKAGVIASVASASTQLASTGAVSSTSGKTGSSGAGTPTTTSAGSVASASTTSSASTSSSTAKSGAASGGMSHLEMKWVVVGLGLLLPGFILGAL